MRITVLVGSPRKGGNTETLADALIEGAKAAGAEVTKYSLRGKKIAPCLACDYCLSHDACVQRDDMAEVYALLLNTEPIDGQHATAGNGSTVGFAMDSTDQADAWHAAGVANGGTSVEDPPGVRESASGNLYLAYLRDPDGNKLTVRSLPPEQD